MQKYIVCMGEAVLVKVSISTEPQSGIWGSFCCSGCTLVGSALANEMPLDRDQFMHERSLIPGQAALTVKLTN